MPCDMTGNGFINLAAVAINGSERYMTAATRVNYTNILTVQVHIVCSIAI